MSSPLRKCTPDDEVPLLPQDVTSLTHNNKRPKTIALVVFTALLAIGGVFLLLAAYKVLPHGVNAVSQWGTRSIIAGSLMVGIGGTIFLIASAVLRWQNRSQHKYSTIIYADS